MARVSDTTIRAMERQAEEAEQRAAAWDRSAAQMEAQADDSREHADVHRSSAADLRYLTALANGHPEAPRQVPPLQTQQRALRAAARITADAPDGLPAPAWMVSRPIPGDAPSLNGQVYGGTTSPRAQIEQWAQYLGVEVETTEDGGTRRHLARTRVHGVEVVLQATARTSADDVLAEEPVALKGTDPVALPAAEGSGQQ